MVEPWPSKLFLSVVEVLGFSYIPGSDMSFFFRWVLPYMLEEHIPQKLRHPGSRYPYDMGLTPDGGLLRDGYQRC